jgi:hypothetical protein
MEEGYSSLELKGFGGAALQVRGYLFSTRLAKNDRLATKIMTRGSSYHPNSTPPCALTHSFQ